MAFIMDSLIQLRNILSSVFTKSHEGSAMPPTRVFYAELQLAKNIVVNRGTWKNASLSVGRGLTCFPRLHGEKSQMSNG